MASVDEGEEHRNFVGAFLGITWAFRALAYEGE
jgi:hypothetical protein